MPSTRRTNAGLALGLIGSLMVAGGALPANADDARTFAAPVIVDADSAHGGNEPSIRVSADKSIYVTAPQGIGGVRVPVQKPGAVDTFEAGGDILWRSDDAGKTWKYLGSYDGSIGGGDSDITSAPDGSLYASGLTLACVTLAASTDKGETWAANPAGCSDSAGVDDRQWNDVHGNDSVWTGFGGLRGLVLQKSLVRTPLPVNGPSAVVNSGDYQWPGVVDVDQKDGTAFMAWNTSGAPNDCDSATTGCKPETASSSTPDEIRVGAVGDDGTVKSGDNGYLVATRTFDTFDSFVAMDTGTDGTMYAAWSERHPVANNPASSETWTMLATSSNHGTSWTTPVKVNATPKTTVFPWVSAGDAGRVAITYLGTDSGGFSPETLAKPDASWFVYSAFSSDSGATFTEQQTTPNKVNQGSICTSGTGCATGQRDMGDFIETDTDDTGCLVTTYTDNARDVVTSTGARTTDNASLIGFVRQSSGPGLKAGTTCGALAPTTDVPEVPMAALLPLFAVGVIGGVVGIRRRRFAA